MASILFGKKKVGKYIRFTINFSWSINSEYTFSQLLKIVSRYSHEITQIAFFKGGGEGYLSFTKKEKSAILKRAVSLKRDDELMDTSMPILYRLD